MFLVTPGNFWGIRRAVLSDLVEDVIFVSDSGTMVLCTTSPAVATHLGGHSIERFYWRARTLLVW